MNSSSFNSYTLNGSFDVFANSSEVIDFVAVNAEIEYLTATEIRVNDAITFSDNTSMTTAPNPFDPNANITFTGIVVFDPTCPQCPTAPSGADDLVNKAYADGIGSYLLSTANTWTGTNAFNTSVPTSTVSPVGANDLCRKAYVDSVPSNLLSSSNAWTGSNTFNTAIPTTTLIPTSSTEFATKGYADSLTTNVLASNNTWTGTNSFTKPVAITSTTQPQLTITNGSNTANFKVSSNALNLDGTSFLNASQQTSFTNTTNSFSVLSGAVQVSGGVGIAKNCYVGADADVGGLLNVAGATTLAGMTATTGSFSSTLGVSGATTLSSTLHTVGNATFDNDATVSSNLFMNIGYVSSTLYGTTPSTYLPYIARVSFKYSGSTLSTIGTPYNCSISRTSGGIYVITFTTASPHSNYLLFGSGYASGTTDGLTVCATAKSTSSCTIRTQGSGGSVKDPDPWCDIAIML